MNQVDDLARLEFQKPDLVRAEAFATRSASPRCHAAATSCICAAATQARRVCSSDAARHRVSSARVPGADEADVRRLATATARSHALARYDRRPGGGSGRSQRECGSCGRGIRQPAAIPAESAGIFNVGAEVLWANAVAATTATRAIQRLGHVVLETSKYRQSLNWYLLTRHDRHDFLFFPMSANADRR